MKIIKHDKKLVIQSMDLVKKTVKIDFNFYKLNENLTRENEICLYDFYGCLNAIYIQLTGETRNSIYDTFGTFYEPTKPNAWVKDIGFLPDVIDDCILNRKIKSDDAYSHIIKYLKMLIKIKKQHESKKTT